MHFGIFGECVGFFLWGSGCLNTCLLELLLPQSPQGPQDLVEHKNTDLGFQFGSWLSGVLHVHGVGRDGCCGDTEMLSGSSGVNSCGVLTKITSHLLLSGLQ